MKIDGKLIAYNIKQRLKERIILYKKKSILPHLCVILIGNDPASVTYVGQKQKAADEIGVKLSLFKENESYRKSDLIEKVNKLNADPSVHAVIIQKPVPIDIEKEELDRMVVPQKDVDGFHPDSPYNPPVASAVLKILEWVEKDWKEKKILVIGRGETAGKPIAITLTKMGVPFTVAHSKTENFKKLCLSSDIIISCVGKPNIVRHDMVSRKTILIGVGLHSENGKLQTDYNQEEIAGIAAYYTPVPGGVGPVNVACLFENLLLSVKPPVNLA